MEPKKYLVDESKGVFYDDDGELKYTPGKTVLWSMIDKETMSECSWAPGDVEYTNSLHKRYVKNAEDSIELLNKRLCQQ